MSCLIVDESQKVREALAHILLSLGIRDIHLGPSLPAFISPTVLQVLVDKFAIKPISTPEADMQAILG